MLLSFPNIAFEKAGDFSAAEADEADCFDPDSGELFIVQLLLRILLKKIEDRGHNAIGKQYHDRLLRHHLLR